MTKFATKDTAGIYIVRHGKTELNTDGKSPDRIRGWLDVPLDKTGLEEADRIADFIKTVKPARIYSSDLQRASKTAEKSAKEVGVDVEETDELRPWNLGTFQGENAKKAHPHIRRHAKPENADEKIPEGESFNEFKGRLLGKLKEIMAVFEKTGETAAMFTHFRAVKLIQGWLETGVDNDDLDLEVFDKNDAPTGTALRLYKDGDAWKCEEVGPASESQKSGAS